MQKFKEIKALQKTIARRRTAFGIGINDAEYMTTVSINGKIKQCPIHSAWALMLERCYSDKSLKKHPRFIGITVCKEWRLFSNFRDWVLMQDDKGMRLNISIKVKGNKVYSPDTCLFIPQELEGFLDCKTTISGLPKGVSENKDSIKYTAAIKYNGKKRNLGRFNTIEQAKAAFDTAFNDRIDALIKNDTYLTFTPYLEQHKRQ